jgi:4-amino-4-deoxy-L-arabinose transferase-like glycosyltransferase
MIAKLFSSGWWLAIISIVVLAAFLRLWGLGEVPHGMAWDEAAIGYNGYAILTTRRDEYLVKLPVSFQSFGDYKAPLAIYLNGIFTYFLGMDVWVVRLPFALAGVMAMAGVMWLVYELASDFAKARWWQEAWPVQKTLAVSAGLVMTFSVWHFHYSRVAFESGMSLTWLVLAAASFLKALRIDAPKTKQSGLFAFFSVFFACASIYTYHSAKIVTPLIMFSLAVWHWKALQKQIAMWIVMVVVGLCLMAPLINDSVSGTGNERWKQASLFSREGSVSQKLSQFGSQFVMHFSPAFVVGGQTDTLRHGDGKHGVLSWLEFAAVIIALSALVSSFTKREAWCNPLQALTLFAVWWVVVGTIPAALGVDVPHSNRGLLALPGYIMLVTLGLHYIIMFIREQKMFASIRGTHQEGEILVKSVVGTASLFLVMSFLPYYHGYWTSYAAAATEDFKDGYMETLKYVIPYEKGTDGKKKVDQIIFTTEYGQPYIYALFARKTNPIWYRGGSLNTFLFTDSVAESDMLRPNTIVVASANDPGKIEDADHVVYGKDGSVRFKIYVNQE